MHEVVLFGSKGLSFFFLWPVNRCLLFAFLSCLYLRNRSELSASGHDGCRRKKGSLDVHC